MHYTIKIVDNIEYIHSDMIYLVLHQNGVSTYTVRYKREIQCSEVLGEFQYERIMYCYGIQYQLLRIGLIFQL